MTISDDSAGSKFKTVRNPLRYEIKDGQWVRVHPERRKIKPNPAWRTPVKGELIGFTLTAVP